MKTARSTLVVVAVVAAAVLSGCAADPGAPTSSTTVVSPSPTPSATPPSTTSPSGTPSDASPVGGWGDDASGKANVVFTDDGTLSGNDGCNHFSGSWKQAADGFEISAIVSTLMACPDVDAWLATMTAVTVDGDTLHVFKDGTEIGTLPRQ